MDTTSMAILRHILVLAEGQLGDLLLLTPALRAVRESFPQATISLAIFHRRMPQGNVAGSQPLVVEDRVSGNAIVFAENPNVDRVLNAYRPILRSAGGFRRLSLERTLLNAIRRLRADAVVSTFPEDRFALLAFASGAAVRVGQRRQSFWRLLTHTPDLDRARGGVLQYYCGLVEAMGARVGSLDTEYHVPASTHTWALEVLRAAGVREGERVISVHPGASGDYKIWPPQRYAELANTLYARRAGRILLCPGSADSTILEAIRGLLHPKILIVDSATDVEKLGAILSRSALCITNDSGPRHLAVALGIPVLALFRKHHDREWGVYSESSSCRTLKGAASCPVCPPEECLDRIPPGEQFGSYCMRMIEVSEAVRTAEEMLSA